MSAQFQHSLVGRKIDDSPADVAYGSRITIRHVATNGGYLHSHLSTYPDGSKRKYAYAFLCVTMSMKLVWHVTLGGWSGEKERKKEGKEKNQTSFLHTQERVCSGMGWTLLYSNMYAPFRATNHAIPIYGRKQLVDDTQDE